MDYIVQNNIADQPDFIITDAVNASDALRKHLHHKIGQGWTFTRHPSGWIIASPTNNKQLDRTFYKLKEVSWNRNDRFPI
jgi:hypothetical protein